MPPFSQSSQNSPANQHVQPTSNSIQFTNCTGSETLTTELLKYTIVNSAVSVVSHIIQVEFIQGEFVVVTQVNQACFDRGFDSQHSAYIKLFSLLFFSKYVQADVGGFFVRVNSK